MKRAVSLIHLFLAALTLLGTPGRASAALLDVGPTVTQVNPSTDPLGHGFPLWYRDSNRMPLEICTVEAMCLFARPDLLSPVRFPTNIPDEMFWWVGDASIPIPQQGALTRDGDAILVQAIEAAFSTGNVVPGAQVSFARIRIRVDTPYAGTYTVTTPFKQFEFTVAAADIAGGINHTEDIGIGENGVFTGALKGSIGPFLYCTNAPIAHATGSYVGDPNVPCNVLGSTFNPPNLPGPANYFRVQGPNGFDIQTTQFSVMGKIYTGDIPTPLAVEKVTYSRDAGAMQTSVFATAQPMSNQKVGGTAIPGQFALTNTSSALQLSGTDISTTDLATNNPGDGKFYGGSSFASPVSLPATVKVTNTADVPVTEKVVPLVDEVVVTESSYAPATKTLKIVAASLDKVGLPTLEVFMPDDTVLPDKKVSLGSLSAGQLNITFPATISGKTYNIPPSTVTVESSSGGSTQATVNLLLPTLAPVAVNDAVTTPYLTPVTVTVLANDTTTGALDPATVAITAQQNGTAVVNGNGSVTFTPAAAFSGAASFSYTVKDTLDQISNIATVTVTVSAPLAIVSNLTITPDQASPQPSGSAIVFTAAAQGSSNYLYRFLLNGNEVQPFGPTATWTMSGVTPPGNHLITVEVKTNPLTAPDRATTITYQVGAVITKSPGANGTITGADTAVVNTSATFNIIPNAGFHVADVLVNGVSVGAVPSYTISSITGNTTVSATFSDVTVLWRNSATGQNQIWFMNDLQNAAVKPFETIADQNWQIVGKGDFNNDGRADILWRNVADGQNSVWFMNGVTRTGSGSIPTLADQNWKVVGVGDSNGDGKHDIFWRNTSTGQNSVWYMDGATRLGSGALLSRADQNWEIVGIADSNGDGKSDIFWRNISDGQNAVWYMDGITRTGSVLLPSLADQNWKIVGVRDFNGDAKPDLLWRNITNGQNAVWYMNGTIRTGSGLLSTLADQNWKIVGH